MARTPAERYAGLSDDVIDNIERERTRRFGIIFNSIAEAIKVAAPSGAGIVAVRYLEANWINAVIGSVFLLVLAAMGYRIHVSRGEKERLRERVAQLEQEVRTLTGTKETNQ